MIKQEGKIVAANENELLSVVKRCVNSLKEKEAGVRKNALAQLNKIITSRQMSSDIFEQIMHMGLKDIIKCYYDHLEVMRENSIALTIDLLSRCNNIRAFLPYIFQALKDRTNCVDLQGIDKLPQKLRPQPGQKPKVMLKLIQNCEQVRLLYCQLARRIIMLLESDKHEMAQHLQDMVNILRALIMDPAPQVQKQACQVLKIFCDQYKGVLLHFTETMGRAVLLPLISKKSKIRIAGLNALTSIFWCGLWKYNAFVFQNLIGFRDPNSVPIKDFYEPSNNINYLATFIIDPNVKVRQQFMKNLKVWVCDLNDKYDHHGKLVPYLLSGLFDADEQVKQTALQAIVEIGRQTEQEKQKQFRQNKQFAIDAAWTWDGKLCELQVEQPLKKRPSLGSRYFIRGHVRKFWSALYKQIRDINQQNRLRSANLALYGVIYTQNYLTQFLDNMIPQLLPSILSSNSTDVRVSDKICKIFYYIGRYCQQTSYIHLIKSALEGKLVQNEQFVKCSMKGLSMMIKGNLQAIPQDEHLCHKKKNIIDLLDTLQDCQISGDVYNFNCVQARQIAQHILEGIITHASEQQAQQIFNSHFLTLAKLFSVSYFQEIYSRGYSLKSQKELQNLNSNQIFKGYVNQLDEMQKIYPKGFEQIQQFLSDVFCNPPSLMDSDWKLLTIFYRYLCIMSPQNEAFSNLFLLVQDTICDCLSKNKSIQLLAFSIKFIANLVSNLTNCYQHSALAKSDKLLRECMINLQNFKPIRKVPIYDQHLMQQDENIDNFKTYEQNYFLLFIQISKCFSGYYLNKAGLSNAQLAQLLHYYFICFRKARKSKDCELEAIKTVWAIFQKIDIQQKFGETVCFTSDKKITIYVLPQVIDFCIQRIQEYLDSRLSNFVFSILNNIAKGWPTVQNITEKLPSVYLNFPDLFQKLFKYTLNEKDIQLKQKYLNFLQKISKKMPRWFKHELNMAEQNKRFEKSKLIQQIIRNSNI